MNTYLFSSILPPCCTIRIEFLHPKKTCISLPNEGPLGKSIAHLPVPHSVDCLILWLQLPCGQQDQFMGHLIQTELHPSLLLLFS